MRKTLSAWRRDVLRAHVDVARQAEQRAGRRGRDAVLAGAGLGDDARLAHALREQRLAERVVDLVRAGVVEVFALEVDRAPPAARAARRGRAARAGRRSRAGASPSSARKAGSARSLPAALELVERGHQRLRHVAAAVGAVVGAGSHPARQIAVNGLSTVICAPPRRRARRRARCSWSLMPGAASRLRAASTAQGRTASTAAADVAGREAARRASRGPRALGRALPVLRARRRAMGGRRPRRPALPSRRSTASRPRWPSSALVELDEIGARVVRRSPTKTATGEHRLRDGEDTGRSAARAYRRG